MMRVFFFWLYFPVIVFAQEFHVYENGLIYSEATIDRLNRTADSLNIRFKTCDRKAYRSFGQTYGEDFYASDSLKITAAISLIKRGGTRVEMCRLLGESPSETMDSTLIIRYNYFDTDSNKVQTRTAILGQSSLVADAVEQAPEKVYDFPASDGGYWYYQMQDTWDKKLGAIYIYYLATPFVYYDIPSPYDDWIAYSECMIDTNTTVLLKEAERVGAWGRDCPDEDIVAQEELVRFLNTIHYPEDEPEAPSWYNGEDSTMQDDNQKAWEAYEASHIEWEGKRDQYIMRHIKKKKVFNGLLAEAYEEARTTKCIQASTVDILSRFYSKEAALYLLRLQIRVGFCSFDSSPREHLKEISLLAAESGNWNVFLKAHLDLVNDRVRRNSDNSMAYKYRGVYVKELEALHLNLMELLPGMNFRIDRPASQHYYGSITKTARMMAMSSRSEDYQRLLLSVAGDTGLDIYNRVIFAFIARNFIYYAYGDDSTIEKELGMAIADFPLFLQESVMEAY